MSNILRIEPKKDCVSQVKIKKKKKRKKKAVKTRFREPKKVVQCKVEEIDMLDADSCISIWQSVVIQALYDLVSGSDNYEQKLDRANAIAWFGQGLGNDLSRPTDFALVCELAQLDPFAIIKLARKVIQEEKAKLREKLISGFNFRTVRKTSSSRVPKKKYQ